MKIIVGLLAILLLTLVLAAVLGPARAHGDAAWIMADPVTRYCCGTIDCRPLEDKEVTSEGGRWFVNGQPVAPADVHPTAPEGGSSYWACFYPPDLTVPRCLFLPALF